MSYLISLCPGKFVSNIRQSSKVNLVELLRCDALTFSPLIPELTSMLEKCGGDLHPTQVLQPITIFSLEIFPNCISPLE